MVNPSNDEGLRSQLPLRPVTLAVLAALARGPRAGFEVLEAIETAGGSILGPGSLYRLLRELRESGRIERVPPPAAEGRPDERIQYHGLTATGRRLLEMEAERLRRTLDHAGLLGASGEGG